MNEQKMREAFEAWLEEGIEETGTIRPSSDKVASYLAVWEGAWQAATAATQRDAMAVAEAVRDAAVIMMDEKADSCRNEGMDFEPFMCASAMLLAGIDLAAIVEAVQPAAASGAAADLERVYDEFGIGAKARTIGILLGNVSNAMRRAECLAAIEREFFMVPGEVDEDYPDKEPEDECLLNWGHGPADYVETFREALQKIAAAEAAQPASAQQQGEPVTWQPIEMAPDGGDVIVWNGQVVTVARHSAHRPELWEVAECGEYAASGLFWPQPTHWMPTPSAPKGGA